MAYWMLTRFTFNFFKPLSDPKVNKEKYDAKKSDRFNMIMNVKGKSNQ